MAAACASPARLRTSSSGSSLCVAATWPPPETTRAARQAFLTTLPSAALLEKYNRLRAAALQRPASPRKPSVLRRIPPVHQLETAMLFVHDVCAVRCRATAKQLASRTQCTAATRRTADEDEEASCLDHVLHRRFSRPTRLPGTRRVPGDAKSGLAAARYRPVHHADGAARIDAAVPESTATRLPELRRRRGGALAAEPRRRHAGDPLRRPKLARRCRRQPRRGQLDPVHLPVRRERPAQASARAHPGDPADERPRSPGLLAGRQALRRRRQGRRGLRLHETPKPR